MAASAAPLTVAGTGPTGTFGYGLMPRETSLEALRDTIVAR
jgi:hypothetical protein